jgi:NSS family neurotransmitter:Na+ symporter
MGFILAASGCAIGLGNIVFFSANAYRFGGGAFYLPYFIALFLVGIPVMVMEFALGHSTRRAFPQSMHRVAGRKGEFVGWWAIFNASFITMYYITIIGWVVGMFLGTFGALWKTSLPVPAFGLAEGDLLNPYAFFFRMISSWSTILAVLFVWFLNAWIVRRGTGTIEPAVKVFVPLMWIFMLILLVRGVTLDHGGQGVLALFTPSAEVMKNPDVWQGAFSQIFFSLSLGFGVLTAYASYLPPKSDQVNNAVLTSTLNCGFEYIAGVTVFSILFAFAMVPQASTLGMMFFIVPQGISQLPGGSPAMIGFGLVFFLLLILAGLSSSVSLVEALVSAVVDKFKGGRKMTLIVFSIIGTLGSFCFALPIVIDRGLDGDGTLGFTLLDLFNHWAFDNGLLIVGLLECLLIGWIFGIRRLESHIHANSRFRLGPVFPWLIKVVIPGLIAVLLFFSVRNEIRDGLYGGNLIPEGSAAWLHALPLFALLFWLVASVVAAAVFTYTGRYEDEKA